LTVAVDDPDDRLWPLSVDRDRRKTAISGRSEKTAYGQKEPVEGVQEIRGDSVCYFECPAGDCYLMEVWIVAVFIVFLNE